MLVKTLLNQIERFKGFVFGKVSIRKGWLRKLTLVVEILPRMGSRPECSVCGRKRPTYDTSRNAREVDYIPLWSYRVVFRYFPRRVNCPWDGIQVEWVPLDGRERADDPLLQDLSGPLGPSSVLERGVDGLRDQLGMRLPGGQGRGRLRPGPSVS